jgi:hypothetical protein
MSYFDLSNFEKKADINGFIKRKKFIEILRTKMEKTKAKMIFEVIAGKNADKLNVRKNFIFKVIAIEMFFEIDIHENGWIKKEDFIRQFETYEELQQMIKVLDHVKADKITLDLYVEIMVAKFKQVFNHFFQVS